jgi:hypothetical protein
MKTLTKAKKVAAIAAMTLLMTSAATAAYSLEEETLGFSITAEEPISLCADHEMEYPGGDPVSWQVATFVTLTEINDPTNTSQDTLTVPTNSTVEMSVDLEFFPGSECDPTDGSTYTVSPDGTVSATWSVTDFTMQLNSCPPLTPCSASMTSSVMAQMTSPSTAGPSFFGSVLVSWVP